MCEVKNTLDTFKEGGVIGLIKVNGITKSFACEYDSVITKKQLREHFNYMAISLGISLELEEGSDA